MPKRLIPVGIFLVSTVAILSTLTSTVQKSTLPNSLAYVERNQNTHASDAEITDIPQTNGGLDGLNKFIDKVNASPTKSATPTKKPNTKNNPVADASDPDAVDGVPGANAQPTISKQRPTLPPKKADTPIPTKSNTTPKPSFSDNFSKSYTLEENSPMEASSSPDWWVNSGGRMYMKDGVANSIFGELPTNDVWRLDYKDYSPVDTDQGYHPQNLLRFVQRDNWTNFNQSAYYKISKYHLSESDHRAESNGLLLFNRYVDGFNLYYAGIRVDGTLIIKKKKNGNYYTMAQKQVIPGTWNRDSNPNLLPLNTWIGLKTNVTTLSGGKVSVKLYYDIGRKGSWTFGMEAIDDGKSYGGSSILSKGHAGIRTDFMDVSFDDYSITEL